MKSSLFALTASLFTLPLAGCGSGSQDPPAPAPVVAANGGHAALSGMVIEYQTGEFEIPAGESFFCFWTNLTLPTGVSVLRANAKQSAGGHHVTMYAAGVQRPPQMRACSGTTEMADWQFVIGAGGEGAANDFASLPEGLAIKVNKGQQILVQAHYINTSGAPQKVNDTMRIELTDPATVKAYAADFVIDDDQWQLLPHKETTSVMTCTVPEDINLVMILGHMHEAGKHYKLEVLPPGETEFKVFQGYEHPWLPAYASHPPSLKWTMDAPVKLAKGTKFRQTCNWMNNKDEMLSFPTEMCIGFGYRFPATERMFCERDK